MKKMLVLSLVVMLFNLPLYAAADDYGYQDTPATKFAYGVGEVATAWSNVPLSIMHYSEKFDPITGTLIGIPVGSALAVKDCVEGTFNATFFLVPPYESKREGYLHSLTKLDERIKEYLW